MKTGFYLMLLAVLLLSCGKEPQEPSAQQAAPEAVKDSLSTIEGEFIYRSDAAVLKGKNFVYGVELDSVGLQLAKKVDALKTDDFDLIHVVVRAKIIQNPRREGWDEMVQIKKILEIPEAAQGQKPEVTKKEKKP